MSTHLDFALKLLKWYKYHLKYHFTQQKFYDDLEPKYLPRPSITAADEITDYNENSQWTEDHNMMDNAANNQMEVLRCLNERDMPIDIYWQRWRRWIQHEHDELDKFKDDVEAKHKFIKSTSKPARDIGKAYIPNGDKRYAIMKIDPMKATQPDTGEK